MDHPVLASRLPSWLVFVRATLAAAAGLAGLSRLDALEASRLFGDHMVLQRGQPLPISGSRAAPGAHVAVDLRRADGSHVAQTHGTADAQGHWLALLAPLAHPEARPLELRISDGSSTLVFRDVLVGDVWFCGGQSNMNMTLAHHASRDPDRPFKHTGEAGGFRLPDYDELTDGSIRHFGVEHTTSPVALNELSSDLDRDVWTENRWQRSDGPQVGAFTAAGYAFARTCRRALLARGEDVPIGLIRASWGGTYIETWMSPEALASPAFSAIVAKRRAFVTTGQARARAAGDTPAAARLEAHVPSSAFHAMIHPWRRFPIRGFLWYQGENNTADHAHYANELRALIRDWRARWADETLPFIWVQLPGLPRPGKGPDGPLWPRLRVAQAAVQDEPHTAMVTALDLGSTVLTPRNSDLEIHPRTKDRLGARLALAALKLAYGFRDLPESPRLLSASRDDAGRVQVRFNTGGVGLATSDGKPVAGVELLGADGVAHPAEQVWLEGDSLWAASREVAHPAELRYAWTNEGRGNLCRALPATLPRPGGEVEHLGFLPVGTFSSRVLPTLSP